MIEIICLGTPITQGSKNSYAVRRKNAAGGWEYTGQTRVVEQSQAKLRPWRSLMKAEAVEVMDGRPPLSGPLAAYLTVTLRRPDAHFGTGRNAGKVKLSAPRYPHKRPDGPKYERAVHDALSGTVWKDDAQVVHWAGIKLYVGSVDALPEPGVKVQVWQLPATIGGTPNWVTEPSAARLPLPQ